MIDQKKLDEAYKTVVNTCGKPGYYRLDANGQMYLYKKKPWHSPYTGEWAAALGDYKLIAIVKPEQWPEDDFWKTWSIRYDQHTKHN